MGMRPKFASLLNINSFEYDISDPLLVINGTEYTIAKFHEIISQNYCVLLPKFTQNYHLVKYL